MAARQMSVSGARVLLPLLLLAACVASDGGPLPTEPVRVAPVPGAAWPPARGEAALVVRAIEIGPDAAQREVPGARCMASSPYYSAEFAAPARLLLPDFGQGSPDVTVACRAGPASGAMISRPQPYYASGLGGWPAIGVSVGTGTYSGVGVGVGWYGGGAGAGGPATVRYPALRVVLE